MTTPCFRVWEWAYAILPVRQWLAASDRFAAASCLPTSFGTRHGAGAIVNDRETGRALS